MNIAYVASEVVPFAKTGGLADVAGALPVALSKLNCNVKVFMPKYYSVDENKFDLQFLAEYKETPIRAAGFTHAVNFYKGIIPNSSVEIYFIDYPNFFHRHLLYTNDYDEDVRFILFSKAVIELIQRLKWKPNIINCNDWQTGLIPLLIKDNYSWDSLFHSTKFVFTIHNIGYQGKFSEGALFNAEINRKLFYPGGPVEFHKSVNFLKTGIYFSEIINTVSETYAKELLTAEYGHGMEGILNKRKDDLYGIVNGVDYSVWNPEIDKFIPYNYSIDSLHVKQKNKEELLKYFQLPFNPDIPVIGIISRLAIQKGFDIISEAMSELIKLNVQWIILGSGEPKYEDMFRSLSYNYPHKFGVYFGYNNELSHLIEAGSDMFLMPSSYEPCGLNQIYSLKYGTVPIVRKTGGLADTVHDWHEYDFLGDESGNGFSFNDYTGYALYTSVNRALEIYRNKQLWCKIQINGMSAEYSWDTAALKYKNLYNLAVNKIDFNKVLL